MSGKIHHVLDIDSDDSFMDKPAPLYPGGKPLTSEGIEERLEPEHRRAHGLGELPKLPPPIER